MSNKVILIIMDGWGKGTEPSRSAIAQANTPFIDSLYQNCPNTELTTHSEAVGLPEGQMGNSEVGHLNIGAGRVVYQELLRVNNAIKDGSLAKNNALLATLSYCKEKNKKLHLIGLVSDGGVHSHINHLKALCDISKHKGLDSSQVFIHAFTDGRDCDPKSGKGFIGDLENFLKTSVGQIATVTGRYYAMDRDNRWERIKIAYDALTIGAGETTDNFTESIEERYQHNETDEFLKPLIKKDTQDKPLAVIEDGDAVICFNFRTDRCREITIALTQKDIAEQGMKTLNLHYTTMNVYDHSFAKVHHIFNNNDLSMTLGEVVSKAGLTQLRAAETEKYPHVTFFFSGGRELPFEGESRVLAPSPKVATYDLQPEMSAPELTFLVCDAIEKNHFDFVCINFANTDMVGHTGVFSAAIKAAEVVDTSVREITDLGIKLGYTLLITADHGNADYMVNDDGSPNTAHTMNPVPLFLVNSKTSKHVKSGKLADIAPTILEIMELKQPKEMTGESLLLD